MYQQQTGQPELSFPSQRAIIRNYLFCDLWLNVVFSVLYFLPSIYLLVIGDNQVFYNAWFGACFMATAIRTIFALKRVDLPDISTPRFRRTVEGLMCMEWVIILVNGSGAFYTVIFQIFLKINNGANDFNLWLWSVIAGLHLVVLIPFSYQATRHQLLKSCLLQIGSGPVIVVDEVSISNDQPPKPQGQPGYIFVQNP